MDRLQLTLLLNFLNQKIIYIRSISAPVKLTQSEDYNGKYGYNI